MPGLVDPATSTCVPNPERLDRISYFQTIKGVRTPIATCAGIDPVDISKSAAQIQLDLLKAVHTTPSPNPCLIPSIPPPSLTDTAATLPATSVKDPTFRVLFQNREIRFMLLAFEKFPGNSDLITFDVHGGFLPDQVIIPTTIDINTPNRIALGPVDSQGQAADLGATREFPFMFVIDQRRLGSIAAGVGATRGQVLRINPRRATTIDTSSSVPIYDDPVSTSNLWPIQ